MTKQLTASIAALALSISAAAFAQEATDDVDVGLSFTLDGAVAIDFPYDLTFPDDRESEILNAASNGCLNLTGVDAITVSVSGANTPAGTTGFYVSDGSGTSIRYLVDIDLFPIEENLSELTYNLNGDTITHVLTTEQKNTFADGASCDADSAPNVALEGLLYNDSSYQNLLDEDVAGSYPSISAVVESEGLGNGTYDFTDTLTITVTPDFVAG